MFLKRNSVPAFSHLAAGGIWPAMASITLSFCQFGSSMSLVGAVLALPKQESSADSSIVAGSEVSATPDSEADRDVYPLRELPPLCRMVLYNSGVGQMQHRGTIDGNARLEIRFGDYAVDDVLKSLVIVDHGGGYARAFEYKPAPDPEEVAAGTIGSPMTLAQLMQSFRGEEVLLTSNGEEWGGIIYGLENRASGGGFAETVVLLTDRGMQSVPISSINRLLFRKEELRMQLAQAMDGLVKARRQNEKIVNLILEGKSERIVEFGYIIDMPIWRMTYRLAIDGDKAFLQGWAHVDNVTGVDWKDIEIELRSGQPYVWHANVFSPLRTQRPSVGDSVYEFSGMDTAVSRWFGFDSSSGGFSQSGLRQGGGGFGGGGFGGGGFGGGNPGSEPREEADEESTFRSFAAGSQDRQMVRYKIDHLVTLKSGHSAGIPVLGHTLPVLLVTVWTDTVDSEDSLPPAFGVEIVNETGLPIVSGPVSVSRNGDFSGDARLPRLAEKESKTVIFGVDRAVRIDRQIPEPVVTSRNLTIEEDQAVTVNNVVTRKIYQVRNDDVEPRSLVLFVPFEEKKGLMISPEPHARSEGILQYRMELGAQSTASLEVSLSIEEKSFKALELFNSNDLLTADREKAIVSDEDRQFLQKLVDWNQRIEQVAASAGNLQKEQTRLMTEQVRMRENVQALKENPDAARPFIEKMLELENSLEKNRAESSVKQAELSELKKQKADAIIDSKHP